MLTMKTDNTGWLTTENKELETKSHHSHHFVIQPCMPVNNYGLTENSITLYFRINQ